MPVQSLQVGVLTSITQNVQYALPARKCFVRSAAAVESSLDGSTWAALTGANTTGVGTSDIFVRCTTANTLIVAKPDA